MEGSIGRVSGVLVCGIMGGTSLVVGGERGGMLVDSESA